MSLQPARIGRRVAIGAVSCLSLTATLGLAAGQAQAAYSAKVAAGTLQITGDKASDRLAIFQTPTTLVADVGEDGTADFTFDRSTFTSAVVSAGGGDDVVHVSNAVNPVPLTIDGGSGDDTLVGGNGVETLLGGVGNDTVSGGIGADVVRLGTGNDHFQWNPGDGSDSVEGEAGTDVVDFNGSNIGEQIGISANGPRVRLTRDVALVTMDFAGIETANVRTLGGSDTVTAGNLTGTELHTVNADLNAFDGGADGSPDTVIATGTDGDDNAILGSTATDATVTGLGSQVHVTTAEPALDNLTVDGGAGSDTATYKGTAAADSIGIARNVGNTVAAFVPNGMPVNTTVENLVVQGLGGNDTITGQNGIGTLTQLTIDGGSGDDTVRGGDGNDTLLGGVGNDTVSGGIGADVVRLGTGNDHFQWNPGDGSDSVEGEAGTDVVDFNGSNIGEQIGISANGPRVRLTRDVAQVTMDFAGIETASLRTLGGVDIVTVNDLTGTALKTNDIDLSAFDGGGDATSDTVIVNGTSGRDRVNVTRAGSQVLTTGLAAQTRIAGSEGGIDVLRVNTLGGDDDVTIAPDVSDLIAPFADLGDGE
jgi:Ca2+-binding RTX toxin-like protein